MKDYDAVGRTELEIDKADAEAARASLAEVRVDYLALAAEGEACHEPWPANVLNRLVLAVRTLVKERDKALRDWSEAHLYKGLYTTTLNERNHAMELLRQVRAEVDRMRAVAADVPPPPPPADAPVNDVPFGFRSFR